MRLAKGSLERRLVHLEANPLWQPRPPRTAEDLLFREKLQEILQKIDPNYSRLVYGDLNHGSDVQALRQYSALTLAVMSRVADHVRMVAQAYLENPFSPEGEVCRSCGYELPKMCFRQCPICGGTVR